MTQPNGGGRATSTAAREHECVSWDDPRFVALCEHYGWDHDQFVALQRQITEDMNRDVAAISEGFCPRCTGHLTPSEHGPWCQSCDLYHHSTIASDGCVIGVGATSGSWKRGDPE
jgi:hypothetical protein